MHAFPRLSPEDERSWRLNEAALDAAAADWPIASARIRDHLARLATNGSASNELIERYQELVDLGPSVLRAEVLALTDQGQALRSLHPLAGLVEPKLRYRIIREVPLR
jgi:hypothetical protein